MASPPPSALVPLQAYHLAMREIKLLRATTHEHVVSVIEAFRSQSSGNVYLVGRHAVGDRASSRDVG